MSSDPNTPDFDSMSPEEMMAWMESLAKRQGADASGFTTSADMEVDEIDIDSVDESVLNQKYIPHGWTEEKWEAHLAKEEAEKQARLTQEQAQPEPESATTSAEAEPELEPAVAQQAEPSADGAVDMDNMSPEELMAWMESLAKRQGADASGFTTAADMDVAEIDPTTVDESILNQKYIPDGWTEEKWDEYLAKEEAKKQQAHQAEPELELESELDFDLEPEYELESEAEYEDELEYEFVDEDDEQLATLNLDDLPTIDIDEEPEEETASVGENPMSWLENLAATDDESEEIELPDLTGIGDDMSGLEAIAQQDADNDPMDWLASLAGDVDDSLPELDINEIGEGLAGLEAFAAIGDEDVETEDEEDESLVAEVEDPVNFLETLANLEGAPEEELSTSADASIPDFDSFMVDEDVEEIDFEDILEDTQPSEELESAWDIEDPSQMESPEAWLDALASSSAGDSEQLTLFDDDEDYAMEDDDEVLPVLEFDDDEEDEDEALPVLEFDDDEEDEDEALPVLEFDDDHDSRVISALNSGRDLSPEDIEQFFSNQFKKAEQFADLDEDFGEDEDIGEVEAAVEIGVPDWLQELSGAPAAQAAVEEEEIEEEDLMADVLAGLDDGDVAQAVDLDWLTDEADEFVDEDEIAELVDMEWLTDEVDLTVDEDDVAEEVDIPDWLKEGAESDTGDVVADIIADELDVATDEVAVMETESGQPIQVDPSDSWTQAFLMEENKEQAEEWYNARVNEITGQMPPISDEEIAVAEEEPVLETVASSGGITLEPASLPIEEELPEGQPEHAPAWLTGGIVDEPLEMPSVLEAVSDDSDIDIPSWLEDSIDEDDEIEIPDWLEDTGSDPIPDWLEEAGIGDIEPASIPDWLTDTVEEPIDVVAQVVESKPEPVSAPPAAIIATPPPAADVTEAIKSAQRKVAEDNLDEALHDYESVVRANEGVDLVIDDLQKLTKDEQKKKNPAIYRVLGDALMRRGDLQDALDTYRRALNLL